MRAAIAALLATVVAFSASAADMVSRHGADTVRISDKPCINAAVVAQVDRVAARYKAMFQAASATVGGVPFNACWIVDGPMAHLLYEDGDHGMIPLSEFKPDGV